MAILENIISQRMVYEPRSKDAEYGFIPDNNKKPVKSFPQIFFSNGDPWLEANYYALYRFEDLQKDIKTVQTEMSHIAKYACWLEDVNLNWLHFPKKKAERCLFRFRGYLIEQRNEGLLAPSTTSAIMNSVIAFYRWASVYGYADEKSKLFSDKTKVISFFDKVGFARTISVTSSELSIPNRARTGVRLEEGLTPISQASTRTLMAHLSAHQNYELYLMIKMALLTGCRHETITTITIDALEKAYPDHKVSNTMRVKVGPGTGVKTKHDVVGDVYFPKPLVIELIHYFNSAEARLRRTRASNALQKNIILTSQGNRYTNQTFGTLLYRLKGELIEAGHTEFGRFKFHQLRATFGTMLMRALLKTQGLTSLNAMEFVKEAMLHKDVNTTWKYINFIEKEPIEEQFLETLWSMFTGSKKAPDEIIDHLTGGEISNEE